MAKKYANFFIARLSSDISASDVEIPITDLPKDDSNNVITEGKLVIDAKRPDKREVIGFTGVDGSKLIGVTRGLGRTIATTHQRNATIEMTVLGSDLTEVHHAAETVSDLPQYTRELLADSIVPGTGEVTVVSGRTVAISDMTYYINGIRLTKTGIPNKTLTATKDTYGYIDASGNVTYQEVTVNAAAPAIPANSIPFVKATTNASAVPRIILLSRGAISTTKVHLIDNTNGVNTSNVLKVIPLTNLTVGRTYVIHHQGAQMGVSGLGNADYAMKIDNSDIASFTIPVAQSAYTNPRVNLTGFFTATATTASLSYVRGGVASSWTTLGQRTLVMEMADLPEGQ